jgi:hypothetical protein
VFPFSASFYNVKLNELDKIVCLYMYCHWKFFQVSLLLVYLCIQGIPEQLGTGKIARLIAVFPQLFCSKGIFYKVFATGSLRART